MDKTKIAAGLSLLISSTAFVRRVAQIKDIVVNWDDTPMLFGGALEPLNALVDVGLTNPEVLDKLVALAQQKRRAVPQSKRVDYQRELMREKRERLTKAIQLEELVRGNPLTADKRDQYKRVTQTAWMRERNEFIASKGNLTWKERNEAANEYWRRVDDKLEKDLAEAKAVLDRPPAKRKRLVQVEHPKPVTALSKAFQKASSTKPGK